MKILIFQTLLNARYKGAFRGSGKKRPQGAFFAPLRPRPVFHGGPTKIRSPAETWGALPTAWEAARLIACAEGAEAWCWPVKLGAA